MQKETLFIKGRIVSPVMPHISTASQNRQERFQAEYRSSYNRWSTRSTAFDRHSTSFTGNNAREVVHVDMDGLR